ncbi:hypothetical protein AVEN_130763-1 [Araneus ventricosus]|uniref:Uncharacterized protein n=1 Tax=Araneus ventricosus TaxID=182803 RepID=A0A4Y2GKU4_ARAVE|nr:hypothetical protein AVEN_130763-1 [Araneus ventricosus]
MGQLSVPWRKKSAGLCYTSLTWSEHLKADTTLSNGVDVTPSYLRELNDKTRKQAGLPFFIKSIFSKTFNPFQLHRDLRSNLQLPFIFQMDLCLGCRLLK